MFSKFQLINAIALLAPIANAFQTINSRIEVNNARASSLFSAPPDRMPVTNRELAEQQIDFYKNGPPSWGGRENDPMLIWDVSAGKEKLIQGDSLKTWSYPSPQVENVQVSMKTDGRPLNAKLDLWHGPDYTATTTKIYTENGNLRPYNGVQATPKGMNTVGMYNTGNAEFPYSTIVEADPSKSNLIAFARELTETGGPGKLVQGGAIQSFPFPAHVESVAVLMKTDGRNLKCHIELLQGPNNNKQVVEYYASDGYKRPFFTIIKSPGSGNVVRVTNQNTVEYPFYAWVVPYEINDDYSPFDPVEGGAR